MELIKVGETWPYKIPTDTENPTEWTLKILDQLTASRLISKARDTLGEAEEVVKTGEVPPDHLAALQDACRFGIAGWDKLTLKGESVEYQTEEVERWGRKYSVVSQDLIDKLPLAAVYILGMEIVRGNTLTEDAKKKSGSPGPVESEEATSPS